MKVYFIFDIRKELVGLYKDNQRVLFDILRQIYYLEKEEAKYGFTLFNQLINKIEKNIINQEIFIKYHQYIPYSKKKNIHYINNLPRNEVSRLAVKNSFIKLELEQEDSSFLKILEKYSDNYFVCDFQNKDFFFLNEYEKLTPSHNLLVLKH